MNSEEQIDDTEFINAAFDTTYLLFIGEMSIEMLMNSSEVEVPTLYDPYSLDKLEFVDILRDMLDHYEVTEEYERCAKIFKLINNEPEHEAIIAELVIDEPYYGTEDIPDIQPDMQSIDQLIAQASTIDNKLNDVTDLEIWSILSDADKSIFNGDIVAFCKWAELLDKKTRDDYIERLLDDGPLIPDQPLYNNIEHEQITDDIIDNYADSSEEINYHDNIVISYLDKYTIISHTNLTKLTNLQIKFAQNGIIDMSIRQKPNPSGQGIIYSLIYDSSQKHIPISWN